MKRFDNSRKTSFLAGIPIASIEADGDLLTTKCKFNFAYFDVQDAGQSFDDWSDAQRLELFEKLKEFSKQPLHHWLTTPIGRGRGTVLAIYGAFPPRSKFIHPKHVPHEVQWGRFRLDYSGRLVGFIVPKKYDGAPHEKTKMRFDANTFYVVFLDAKHEFYVSSDKD